MMDTSAINKLESIIDAASGSSNDNMYLNELRAASNRWSIGLDLFIHASSTVSRFFGLSLVREYLAGTRSEIPAEHRLQIRQVLLNWLATTCSQNGTLPLYIENNIATVLTRVLKLDFPIEWPSAFSDLISLSRLSLLGFTIALRVVTELDVEVVMFDDRRCGEEIAHNTLIKDTMRQQNIVKDLVEFLCKSVVLLRQDHFVADAAEGVKISQRCLKALASMIGWIDISLVVNNDVLSLLYDCLRAPNRELTADACKCLYEVVKKGMDPVNKVMMVHNIDLLKMLLQVQLDVSLGSDLEEDEEDELFESEYCDSETYDENLAALMDLLFLEVLSCWLQYEEHVLHLVPEASPNGRGEDRNNKNNDKIVEKVDVDVAALERVGLLAGEMLHQCIPMLFTLLTSSLNTVYSTVIPCLSKLLHVYKQQSGYTHKLKEMDNNTKSGGGGRYFVAAEYILENSDLLTCIYKAMQYPAKFRFDPEDDEDCEEIEAKKQVRKLFVNYCRACPEMCLQLIQAILVQQPQPLATAPFAPLEATLRLMYAFAEGIAAQQYRQYLADDSAAFPKLLHALHESDVAKHKHSQVLLSYFELSSRYVRQSTEASLCLIVSNMVMCGLRHSTDSQVRCRAAYLLLKVAQGMDDKAATLVPIIGSLGDMILVDTADVISQKKDPSRLLTESAELYLLEMVGVVTSSSNRLTPGVMIVNQDRNNSNPTNTTGNDSSLGAYTVIPVDPQTRSLQQSMLTEMVDCIIRQIQHVLQHNALQQYIDEFSNVIAHKIASIGSLSKGYTVKTHPYAVGVFSRACEYGVVPCIETFGRFENVRSRVVIVIHRLVKCLGDDILTVLVTPSIRCLLAYADNNRDTDMAVQVLNQLMIEFNSKTAPMIEVLLPVVMDKCSGLLKELDSVISIPNGNSNYPQPNMAPAHIASEKNSMRKLYLVFLQHISTHGCHSVFYSTTIHQNIDMANTPGHTVPQPPVANIHRLEEILNFVLDCWKGVFDLNTDKNVNINISIRKNAVIIISNLCSVWLSDRMEVSDSCPPAHVVTAFRSLVYQNLIPILLTSCMNTNIINMRDADGIALVADIGGLFYNIIVSNATCNNPIEKSSEFINYIQLVLLPGFGWPNNPYIMDFINLLNTIMNGSYGLNAKPVIVVGVFKEKFKKFMKKLKDESS